MRWLVGISVVVILLATAADTKTSKSLAFATYKEYVGRTNAIVGTFPAALNDGERYFPIQIAIGVRGKGPELTFTSESFNLIDEDGVVYPVATLEEIRAEAGMLEFNEEVFKQYPLNTGSQYVNNRYVMSDFYPAAGVQIATIHLSRESFFNDVIYFPRPNIGLAGVLTLRIQPSGQDETIDVRFEVPLKGKRKMERQQKQASG
jgi:hypothetical protein